MRIFQHSENILKSIKDLKATCRQRHEDDPSGCIIVTERMIKHGTSDQWSIRLVSEVLYQKGTATNLCNKQKGGPEVHSAAPTPLSRRPDSQNGSRGKFLIAATATSIIVAALSFSPHRPDQPGLSQ
jgi:hypothetical protein